MAESYASWLIKNKTKQTIAQGNLGYYGQSQGTWVAPESWNTYATNQAQAQYQADNKSSLWDNIKGTGSFLLNATGNILHSALQSGVAVSDLALKSYSPEIGQAKATYSVLTGKSKAKDFAKTATDETVKTLAEKTNYEKFFNKDLGAGVTADPTKDPLGFTGQIIANPDARGMIVDAAMAPTYIYGGEAGVQRLMSDSSIANRVVGNAILGGELGGVSGIADTFKGNDYNNFGAYVKNATGGAVAGAVLGGATTFAAAEIGSFYKNAKLNAGLGKLGLSKEQIKTITKQEAEKILASKSPKAMATRVLNKKVKEAEAAAAANETARISGKVVASTPESIVTAKKQFEDALKNYKENVLPVYKGETSAFQAKQAEVFDMARKKALSVGKTQDQAIEYASKQVSKLGTAERGNLNMGVLDISNQTKNDLLTDMDSRLSSFELKRGKDALDKLINGQALQENEVTLLEKGLNTDIKHLMQGDKNLGGKAMYVIKNLGGAKQAAMATLDLSATLRQNFTSVSRGMFTDPVGTSKILANSLRYWGLGKGEQTTVARMAAIKASPNFKSAKDVGGVIIQEMDGNLANKADKYATNWLDKIPMVKNIVRPSERHFTMVGNDMRMARWDSYVEKFAKKGVTPENNPKLFKELGELINASTGIGKLKGDFLNKNRVALNAVLFSPRLAASRLHYIDPRNYSTTLNKALGDGQLMKEVRNETLKDLGSMVAISAGVLTAAKMAGASVELDPRSSDGYKVKVGNTRYEVLGGFTPYMRVAAQLITGQSKNTTTGEIQSTSGYGKSGRIGTAGNFVRSKLNPLAGDVVSFASGTDMVGEQMTGRKWLEDWMPLVMQDTLDSLKQDNPNAYNTLATFVAGEIGLGTSTYGSASKKAETKADQSYVNQYQKSGDIARAVTYRTTGTKY